MHLLIAELMLGDVNTISIPTDAIVIISLLIVFALIGYFFNKILSNKTNQLSQKIDVGSNLKLVKKKLEDQLKVDKKSLNQNNGEKSRLEKLNFLSPSKLLGLGSFVYVAIGGASLLSLQHMQKSYESWNTSRANIKLENQSTKSSLSMVHLKPFNKSQTNVKKILYIDPLLSSINSSEKTRYHQVKEKRIENNFSF